MNTKRLLLIVALIAPLFFLQLNAVPAVPYPVKVTQPDGQILTIRIHGDEFFSYTTTTDGYLLKQNSQGIYEYAFLNAQNFIETTGVPAHDLRSNAEMLVVNNLKANEITPTFALSMRKQCANTPQNSKPQYGQANPLRGNARGLVILVNFKDKKFVVPNPKQQFTDLLNKKGYSDNGCTGCASEYFAASSDSLFTPIFDVYGPYDLSQNMAYYGAHSGSQKDANARAMITEACNLANNDGCDFTKYDTDNNNIVDNVFVYYAGHNEAEGGGDNTIWPHRSVVATSLVLDGKTINDYACTSELRSSGGSTMCGPGTFCHEFSHVLGLPDLYDTDYSSSNETPGSWDIMDHGSYNNYGCTPPTYSAAERFFLGYLTPTLLSDPRPCTLNPLISGKEAFLISTNADHTHNLSGTSPNSSQYFLLENRQKEGWDANTGALPATGMLITRVDYSQGAWSGNSVNDDDNHRRVDIMHASGSGSNANASVYPGSSNVTAFYPTTWEGTRIDGSVTSIKKQGNCITFLFRGGGEGYPYAEITISKKFFETEQGTPSDSAQLTIRAKNIVEPLQVQFSDSRHFEVKLSTDNTWKRSISINPTNDSLVNCVVDVRYNPTTASGNNTHKTYVEIVHDGNVLDGADLEGRSTKAMKITIPVATEATNITSSGFTANWDAVDNATHYYLTVFNNKNGSYSEKEEFTKNFSTGMHAGWSCNFTNTTTNSTPSTPVALLFTTEYDRLVTPYYPTACTEISFWVRSEDMKQEGNLYVEGFNGEKWDTIQTIKINRSLTAQTKRITLDESKGYRQFRFTVDGVSTGLAFDDFTATYPMATVQNRILVYGNTANIGSLAGSTEYSYMVQAADEDTKTNTESVTDYSNRISVTTNQATDGKKKNNRLIPYTFDEAGNPVLSFNAEDLKDKDGNNLDIYIFNAQGILIRTIPNSEFANDPQNVCIGELPKNTISIITLGIGHKNKYVKVVK